MHYVPGGVELMKSGRVLFLLIGMLLAYSLALVEYDNYRDEVILKAMMERIEVEVDILHQQR